MLSYHNLRDMKTWLFSDLISSCNGYLSQIDLLMKISIIYNLCNSVKPESLILQQLVSELLTGPDCEKESEERD